VAAGNYQSAAGERRAFPSGLHSLLDDITSCDTPLLDYSLLFLRVQWIFLDSEWAKKELRCFL
jgi:hypothetical protein